MRDKERIGACGGGRFRQKAIARRARARLNCAGEDRSCARQGLRLRAKLQRKVCDEACIRARVSTQAVIDMKEDEIRRAVRRAQMRERNGVAAARYGNRQTAGRSMARQRCSQRLRWRRRQRQLIFDISRSVR